MSVTQLCLTLCHPMDCTLPGPSVHGILQARILEWAVIPFSRWSKQPRDLNPGLLHCRQILYHLSHQGSPYVYIYTTFYLSINQLKDIWVISTFGCYEQYFNEHLCISSVWTDVFISLDCIFIHLGEALLGHMVTLSLTFWGTAILFSKAVVPFYFPSSSMRIPISLYLHQHSLLPVFYSNHPNGCEVVSYVCLLFNVELFIRLTWHKY